MEEKNSKKEGLNVMPKNPEDLKKIDPLNTMSQNSQEFKKQQGKPFVETENSTIKSTESKLKNNSVNIEETPSVIKARQEIINNPKKETISESLKADGIDLIDEEEPQENLQNQINQDNETIESAEDKKKFDALKRAGLNVMPQIYQTNQTKKSLGYPDKTNLQIKKSNEPTTPESIETITRISAGPSELGDIRMEKITPGDPEIAKREEQKRGIVQDSNERAKKAAEAIKKAQGQEHFVRPIRTYEDEVSNFVRENKVSTAKIMMAEQQRRQAVELQKSQMPIEEKIKEGLKEKSNLIKIIFSFVLILGGISILVWAFFFFDLGKNFTNIISTPKNQEEPKIIDNEVEIVINANNKFTDQIRKEITDSILRDNNLGNKQIVEIEIIKDGSFGDGSTSSRGAQITTTEFFQVLDSIAPESLIRGFESSYFLGIIQLERAHPFILFKVKDFDPVFAGMFKWENLLIKDVEEIFPETLIQKEVVISEPQIDQATSTSTTTQSEPETKILPEYDRRGFEDLLIINRDARAIKDVEGKLLFYYAFIDEENLILADDPEVMKELIQRLNTQKLVR